MKTSTFIYIISLLLCFACSKTEPQGCFPSDQLPDHISSLTSFGQRAEWSLDGSTIFFVDSAGGDIWKVDVETKKTKKITKPEFRPEGHGYYRVLCLSNGDLLFTCGPERYVLYFQVMDKSLKKAPVKIDESIQEGPAISRTDLKIAWSPDHRNIWFANIAYKDGLPVFENKKMIIDNSNIVVDSIKYEDILEPQSFRPYEENELIWSQYGNDSRGVFTSETMGYNLETGQLMNYSKSPGQYDEPEGMFPDGEYTLIECDRHNRIGNSKIELYKLKLDGSGETFERLTYFSDVEGYRASNPVVRDDGKMIAFQASFSGSAPGAGCGLYLFDLEKYYTSK
ncbi:hypothetical protein ACFLQX_03065 [Bacteroidota bacterium]